MNTENEGFVCPHCRILFNLPKSLGGNGAHCPGCNKLLTIPSAKDGVLAQGITRASYQQAGLSSLEISHNEATKEGQWTAKRRGEISRFEDSDKALRWMLPLGLIAVTVLGGLAYILLSGGDSPSASPIARTQIESTKTNIEKPQKIIQFNEQSSEDTENLKVFLNNMFAAETVDELLKYCRPTKDLREKMVKFYKGEIVDTKKIKNIKRSDNYNRKPGFITFSAFTTDYEIEQGVIEYDGGIFKLDWESYTAYSEMTWKQMKLLKPTDPVVLRLIVKEADYYNNEFVDETKWQSISIANPHEKEEVLHGYVKKDSAVEQKVTNFGMSKEGYTVTVKAHFPENPSTDNQIIISDVINDSWIGK